MLIDYLAFTIKFQGIDLNYVLNLLNLKDYENYFVDLGSKRGYEHCYKFSNINISTPYQKREDMGIYVDMTGQGCREYENTHINLFNTVFDWQVFFKKLVQEINLNHKINITRIDLAFDNKVVKNSNEKILLDMNLIYQKLINREYVSRFKSWSEIEKIDKKTKNENKGLTYYLGSRQSNCSCKFYDKLVEQKQLYKKDETKLQELENIEHWIRFEITFKNENAMLICNIITYSIDVEKDLKEYVNKCLRFVELTSSNISRCPISNFWINFVETQNISKFKVTTSNKMGYDSTYRWFTSSLCPSLYALMRTYAKTEDFIKDICMHGGLRLNEKHRRIIDNVNVGKKYSNAELWEENNPFNRQNPFDLYNITYNDDLTMFEKYKEYKY